MPPDDAAPRRKPALKQQQGAAVGSKAGSRQAWFISALQAHAFKSVSDPAGLQVGAAGGLQLRPRVRRQEAQLRAAVVSAAATGAGAAGASEAQC